MTWLAATGALWSTGVVLTWVLRRRPRVAAALGILTTLAGAACLARSGAGALLGTDEVWQARWFLPFGTFALRLDPLAGVFLLPIALIGAIGAAFTPGYARLGHEADGADSPMPAYLVLIASMALVVVAADTILLLMAWEVMTVASWHLLARHHEKPEVRAAGVGYLVAGHVSASALLLLFVLLSLSGNGWRVPSEPMAAEIAPAGFLFVLALIGFGIKAAIVPFHVWLPDAHAAAPSPVSALMSGVLVTLGFYGLVRFLPMLGPAPPAWGVVLMALGSLGACGGIVMALSQRDVKRILAYSTIENAGLVTLGIGVATLSTALGRPSVAVLAWTAALLHLWNHAIAKSLLFLSVGAIARRIDSRDLERWGGLLRRLPLLATAVLVGAAAVLGLPGTHGFASEWLFFLALFQGAQELAGPARLAMLLALVAVAFAAGAALACFVRLAGIGLLGHPRSARAAEALPARDVSLLGPLGILAGLCLALVPFLGELVSLLERAVRQLAPAGDMAAVHEVVAPLPWLAGLPVAAAVAVILQRVWLNRSRSVRRSVTWDCGFARPTASMQFTAGSLAQPITRVLQPALGTSVQWSFVRGLWPAVLAWESRTPERALVELYRPAFQRLVRMLGFFSRLQEGQVMVYLRYVGIALLILLLWLFLPVESWR